MARAQNWVEELLAGSGVIPALDEEACRKQQASSSDGILTLARSLSAVRDSW